jgi:transcriptional regulator with XRE-family HTH domain
MDICLLVGKNLRHLRQARGWSQEDLALTAGVDRTYVSGVERGVRNPTVSVLWQLASALQVEVAVLLLHDGQRIVTEMN